MNELETIELSPQWLKDAYDFVEKHSGANMQAIQQQKSFCADPQCLGLDHTNCTSSETTADDEIAPIAAPLKPKYSAGITAAQRAGYCITSEAELTYLKHVEKARLTFEVQKLYPGQGRLQRLAVKKLMHSNGLSEALTPAESREWKARTQSQPLAEITEELAATH